MVQRQKSPKRGQRTDAPSAPSLTQYGSSGLSHSWGSINDEPLLKLKGRRAMKEFREMYDNDAVVGGVVRLATEMVAQTEWSMEAAGTDPATDEKAKFICETSLRDMQSTWQEFIDEVMTMGVFGHAFMEMWFKKRLGDHDLKEFNSRHADGFYGIANIALRAQESLERWNLADDGDILGMWQRPAPSYDVRYIDMHRAVLFRTSSAKNNPEGRAWLRPGWRSWWICKRMQELEGIGIERDVAGYPDFQVPLEYFLEGATADQVAMLAEIKTMVERVRQDKYAGIVRPSELNNEAKPTGFKFGLIQGGSRNAGVFGEIIKRYESRVAVSMLGEVVLIGQDGVGSLALSQTKRSMLAGALGAVLRRIEDVLNRHVFPRLVRANGLPGASAPKLKFEDIETADVLAFSQAIGALVSGGVLTPDTAVETYVRDYLNLPPIGDVSADQVAEATALAAEPTDELVDPNAERALTVVEESAGPAKPQGPSMTPDEAAEYCGVSRSSIIAAIRRGQLPGAKVGSSYRVLREDLTAHMRGGLRKARSYERDDDGQFGSGGGDVNDTDDESEGERGSGAKPMDRDDAAHRYGDMAAMMLFNGKSTGKTFTLRPVGGKGRVKVSVEQIGDELRVIEKPL